MHVVQLNILKDDEIASVRGKIATFCEETGTQLFSLINNAGVATFGPIEWGDGSQMKHVFDVNTWATINLIRNFIPQLVKSESSRVIYISTLNDIGAIPIMSSYFLSKVDYLTRVEHLHRQFLFIYR